MTEFVVATMVKFKNGHDEHGGNFFRCNFEPETRNEVKDLVMYIQGKAFKDQYADKMDLWLLKNGQSNERNP